MPVEPSKTLENTLRMVQKAFAYAGLAKKYWLSFGALWGLVKNGGTIPDNDIDVCTYYGEDYERLTKAFAGCGYTRTHCMVSDTDPSKALHMGFNRQGLLHICVSFWYKWGDYRFYAHDNAHEIQGVGSPSQGYYFKGMPAAIVDDERFFKMVEWPGIQQMYKIRVPLFAGSMLDNEYLCWPYTKQRYNIGAKHQIEPENMASIHKGGVATRYAAHLQSMAEWDNATLINGKLAESEKQWWAKAKQAIAK